MLDVKSGLCGDNMGPTIYSETERVLSLNILGKNVEIDLKNLSDIKSYGYNNKIGKDLSGNSYYIDLYQSLERSGNNIIYEFFQIELQVKTNTGYCFLLYRQEDECDLWEALDYLNIALNLIKPIEWVND